jgi:Phage tail lysozyme
MSVAASRRLVTPAKAPAENPAQEIIDFFTQHAGFTHAQAVGVTAVLKAESGLSTTARGSEGAYGLAQWLGSRQTALLSYAKAKGASPANKQVQLNFLLNELLTSEATTLKQLHERQTATGTAEVFIKKFERPKNPTAALPKINKYIKEIGAGVPGFSSEEKGTAEAQGSIKKEEAESNQGFFERLTTFFEEGLWTDLLNAGVRILLVAVGAVLVIYGIMVAVRPPERAFKLSGAP